MELIRKIMKVYLNLKRIKNKYYEKNYNSY